LDFKTCRAHFRLSAPARGVACLPAVYHFVFVHAVGAVWGIDWVLAVLRCGWLIRVRAVRAMAGQPAVSAADIKASSV